MRDIVPDLERWIGEGEDIALATVVTTWGSAPRAAGAKMAVSQAGEISGSVSGGCVEGAVAESGIKVLDSGKPLLLHFGVADETAWEVGLACGGKIDVFVQSLDIQMYSALSEAIKAEELVSRVTVIRGPDSLLGLETLVWPDGHTRGTLPKEVVDLSLPLALNELKTDSIRPRVARFPLEGGDDTDPVEILIEIFPPPPNLIVVGGVHTAVILVTLANTLGFRTVVIDPRRAFATEKRFGHASVLKNAWPQEAFRDISINTSTAIVMLTHDPKIDDPALFVALESDAFYIGALGSVGTQAKRRRRLQEAGYSDEKINRIRGPIGLPLGGRNPEEIALAIMAEIVAARNVSLTPDGRLQ